MKMTFKVEKVADFSMEVNSPEDFRTYQNMCENIVDDIVAFKNIPTPNSVPKSKIEAAVKDKVPVKTDVEKLIPIISESKNKIGELPETKKTLAPLNEYKPKKLIFFKCKGCGKVTCRLIEDELIENEEVIYCKSCNYANPFSKENLKQGHYNCENCNAKAHFWVFGDDVDVIECKDCKAPVDMKFHGKQNRYVSINLC